MDTKHFAPNQVQGSPAMSLASLTERLTVSTTRPLERVRSNSSIRNGVPTLRTCASHLSLDSGADSDQSPTKRAVLLEEYDDNDDNKASKGEGAFKRAVRGEARLKIAFESLGSLGEHPQRCGRTGHQLIPHGLCGTHGMYEQNWRFEITHGRVVDAAEGLALVTWTVTNLVSNSVTSVTETPEEAYSRVNQGRTICNRVVREALATRHAELERSLRSETDMSSVRAANIKSLMKAVGPARRTVGLLFFGLLHQTVWENIQRALRSSDDDQAEESKVSSPDTAWYHRKMPDPHSRHDSGSSAYPFPPPVPVGYYDDKEAEEDELFEGLEFGSFPNDFVSSRRQSD